MDDTILLDGNSLTLKALWAIAEGSPAGLAPVALDRVRASQEIVAAKVRAGTPVYGVNTGFGHFANVAIPKEDLTPLQINLIRSHACGVGDPLPREVVRGAMALRINCLLRGRSGIKAETLQMLTRMLNEGIHPVIPSQGSVGASGDLAPLAHMALALLGEGEVEFQGERIPAAKALEKVGLTPLVPMAKEGLALINGTQVSTALLALSARTARYLLEAADVCGALSCDALSGTERAFADNIMRERPYRGQAASATNLRNLLAGSKILASHRDCPKVQDAYSLRCMPQVHGAVREALRFVEEILAVEMNAGTDNPMVFAETDEILSGGNFHAAPVALASDTLTMALTDLGAISERRLYRLVTGHLSGLPDFLTKNGGLQSGLMLVQVTAAALVSENRTLSHPASVDTIPTSASQEDHVSMATWAARKTGLVAANTARVMACEAMGASRAMGLHEEEGLETSPSLQAALKAIRSCIPLDFDDTPHGFSLENLGQALVQGLLTTTLAQAGQALF